MSNRAFRRTSPPASACWRAGVVRMVSLIWCLATVDRDSFWSNSSEAWTFVALRDLANLSNKNRRCKSVFQHRLADNWVCIHRKSGRTGETRQPFVADSGRKCSRTAASGADERGAVHVFQTRKRARLWVFFVGLCAADEGEIFCKW